MKRRASFARKAAGEPRLLDIAKAAAVSVPTASLALNNHPRVSSRTRLRVTEVAQRLGYVPNHAARRLVRARFSSTTNPFDHVGFLLLGQLNPELDGPYLSMMRGVEKELSSSGAAMVFLRAGDESGHARVASLVKSGWVDGWLLIGVVDDAALRLVRWPHSPCVVLGGHRCKQPVHSVDINFNSVGRLAVQHLNTLGHRRIGFIGGSMQYPYQWEILRGFRSALEELGLDAREEIVQVIRGESNRSLHQRLEQLVAACPAPTAIFTAEATYETRVLELLRQREVQVPGELSLLGCEMDGPSHSTPSIARIEMPFAEVGRAGASLLREIAGEKGTPARQILVSPSLVEGWSCIALDHQRGREASQTQTKA